MYRLRDENFPCVCIDLPNYLLHTYTHTPALPHQWKPLRRKAGTRKTTHPEVCMCGLWWHLLFFFFGLFRWIRTTASKSTSWHICISLLMMAIICYWLKCLLTTATPRLLNYPAGPILVNKNAGGAYITDSERYSATNLQGYRHIINNEKFIIVLFWIL